MSASGDMKRRGPHRPAWTRAGSLRGMTDDAALQLRPPRNRLDPRAAWWWRTQGALSSLSQLAVVVAVAVGIPGWQPWVWIAVVAAAVWVVVEVLVVPAWRMRVHRWEVTDEAVYAAAGWWTHEWRIAPVSRIQSVDTVRGPLQRRFGLSSVTVTTASAAGPVTIDGLDAGVADDLVRRLAQVTHVTPGDAT